MHEGTKNILRQAGLGKQVDNVEMGLCPLCGKPVDKDSFKDELSIREFNISGMCQACQDDVFQAEEGGAYGEGNETPRV
jgi:hypothetical protein